MSYSVINDAIHGSISFPSDWKDLLKSIIDSANFQRLRHIRQLGMLDLIFPTAVHNRFSHSLGAAFIAWKIGDKLKLDKNILKHTVIAVLLHDIGHGPFSHMFEELYSALKLPFEVKHEDWTTHFLKEYEEILENYKLDYKIITQLIMGKKKDLDEETPPEWNVAADIVSSQLDADRLDYLLRDAHFCGTTYGQIELQWILTHLEALELSAKSKRLGLSKKGWRAAEHFLLARRFMNQTVYQHPKEKVLKNLVVTLLAKISKLLSSEEEFPISNSELRRFLKNMYKSEKDKANFIFENYNYYKTLVDYDIWMLIRDLSLRHIKTSNAEIEEIYCIAGRIYQRQLHHCSRLESSAIETIELIVKDFCRNNSIPDWKVFITKNKIKIYEYSEKSEEVFIKEDTNKHCGENKTNIRKITYYSHLLRTHQDQTEAEYHLACDVLLDQHLQKDLCDRLSSYFS